MLVLPDTDQAVEKAGSAAGETAGWLAKGDRDVLAGTPRRGLGGEAVIEFTAPAPARSMREPVPVTDARRPPTNKGSASY